MTVWTHSFYLAMRTMRESLRQPGVEVGNIFIPLFFLGAWGQHRRIYNYQHFPELAGADFQQWRVFATVSLLVMLSFQLVFFFNFIHSLLKGKPAGPNPWKANTLEWTAASPPPHGNWKELPTCYRGPYEYASPEVDTDFYPQNQPPPEKALPESVPTMEPVGTNS